MLRREVTQITVDPSLEETLTTAAQLRSTCPPTYRAYVRRHGCHLPHHPHPDRDLVCRSSAFTLDSQVLGVDVDPWGNQRVGMEVTGELSRGDFGMTFNQAMGSGNMLVGDKVRLALDISAVKQD
jgi:hypothetical protein